jgi:septum formation protein
MKLILASGSAIRAELLRNAGVEIVVRKPEVDEELIKSGMAGQGGESIALALAEAKALAVPGELVLAADQVLDCGGKLYDKPADLDAARRQLMELRGKSHRLISGVAVARSGAVLWRHVAMATLTMRVFSDSFLDDYLDAGGTDLLTSVGAYKLEKRGAQLFSSVEGDYFTVLGLPLVPVLGFLRDEGVLGK